MFWSGCGDVELGWLSADPDYSGSLRVLVPYVAIAIHFPSWMFWSCAEVPPEAQMAAKTRLPATLFYSGNLHLLLPLFLLNSSSPSSPHAADVCVSNRGFYSPADRTGHAVRPAEPPLSSLQSSEKEDKKKKRNRLAAKLWLRVIGQTGEPPAGHTGNHTPVRALKLPPFVQSQWFDLNKFYLPSAASSHLVY